MSVIENNLTSAYKALKENNTNRDQARLDKINESVNKRNEFINEYYKIQESNLNKAKRKGLLMEAARNNALSTAVKAIYITALEANTLTDQGIILAENLVDNWIKERGGANKILTEAGNKTYFLDRLTQIVEDAAEEEVEEIEKDEEKEDKDESAETEEKSEEDEKDVEEPEKEESTEDKKEEEPKEEVEEPEKEESTEDKKEEEPKEDSEDEDPENTSDGEEFEIDSDDSEDEEEKSIEDAPYDKITTIDGDEENNGKVFEELEKEEDVKKAIELIRQRVADAEETFIKRNAEDKKRIDELLSRISDNVKTVEDMDEEAQESDQAKIAKESVMMNKQKINAITENRPLTVLEKMTRNLFSGITKDQAVREQYLTESGSIDTFAVVESAKVMYAFLETLNTLKLEKVDKVYIEKVLSEM